MPMPRKPDPEKQCEHCGKPLARKMINGRLEDRGVFLRRRFCDSTCFGLHARTDVPTLGGLRSRAAKFRGSVCERCGETENVQIHHVNSDPSNNAPDNTMTLCGPCHTRWHWEHGKSSTPKKATECCICHQPAKPWEHMKRGMCSLHYQRWRKTGDAQPEVPPQRH